MTAKVECLTAYVVGAFCAMAFLALLGGTMFASPWYGIPCVVFFCLAVGILTYADELNDYLEDAHE